MKHPTSIRVVLSVRLHPKEHEMLFSDVQDWLKRIEEEICGKKKTIRGRVFSGVNMEVYVDGEVVVVLDPALEGVSLDDRTRSLIKEVFDPRILECFIKPDLFQKIVKGEEEIKEEDWIWNDEQ